MKYKWYILIAAIVLSLGLVASLRTASPFYFVGGFSSLTANLGNNFFRGINTYISEVNSKKWLQKLTVVAVDHEGRTDSLNNILNAQVKSSDKAKIIVQGSIPEEQTFFKNLEADQKLNFKIAIQYDEVKKENDDRFCVDARREFVVSGALQFIQNNLKAQNLAIVIDEDLDEVLLKNKDLSDRKSQLTSVNSVASGSKHDVILLVLAPEKVFQISNQIRKQGYAGIIVATGFLSFIDIHEQMANLTHDNYFISDFSAWTEDEPINTFNKNYFDNYKSKSNQYAYYGYLCAMKSSLLMPVSSDWTEMKAFKIGTNKDQLVKIQK